MTGKGQHIKATKKTLVLGAYFALAMIIAYSVPASGLCGTQSDPEAAAVLQAARKFLDAEVRRDYPLVYTCFAPSSSYAQSHSYKEYVAEAQLSPDRVVAYRIVAITYIQDNEDRKTYPAVEKFAQVEADVTFLHVDTQYRSEINIGFIFFKEGGKWYKS
jgi:hypothetical protein